MSDALEASYDEVPYESRPFADTHPDRLATVALLFGLEPAPLEGCRVLEIGCARGDNLIPMAIELPNSDFVGIDLSARQIDAAKSLAAKVGADRIDFQTLSALDVNRDLGTFDYIICHGVFSWVPEDVQRAIFRICSELLNPRGIAFLSYNTYPGWHSRMMMREVMIRHVEGVTDPSERVRRCRELVDWIVANSPDRNSPYARKLAEEADTLRTSEPSYILHEFLEIYNTPLYYREFVELAEANGLRVFADARYRTMAEVMPDSLQKAIATLNADPSQAEQYSDYLRERTFRRSLLCRADLQPSPRANPDVVERLRAFAMIRPSNPRPDVHSAASEEFRSTDNTIRINSDNPLLKAALTILFEQFPRSLPFPELHAAVLDRLDHPSVPQPAPFDRSASALSKFLLRCYANAAIELTTFEAPFVAASGDRPQASALALAQISATSVSTLRHLVVSPSAFDRLVLRHLDGSRDRSQIVEDLILAVQAGEFVVQRDSQVVRDSQVLRDILSRSLEPSLKRLANCALLIA